MVAGKRPSAKQAADSDEERFKKLGLDQGVVSATGLPSASQLPMSRAMRRANGKDIVKKSSTRKNRYMLVFNCLLAPNAAGRMGVLAHIDTKTPVLYLEFPDGRLKLFGRLAFPHNKYMVLRLGGNGPALCEDVFETLIVFYKAAWVGTKEANPDENELPMPVELEASADAGPADYTYGASAPPEISQPQEGAHIGNGSLAAAAPTTAINAVASETCQPENSQQVAAVEGGPRRTPVRAASAVARTSLRHPSDSEHSWDCEVVTSDDDD